MTTGGVCSPATPRRTAGDLRTGPARSRGSQTTGGAPAATRLCAGRHALAVVGERCVVVPLAHRPAARRPDDRWASLRPGASPNLEPIYLLGRAPDQPGRTNRSAVHVGEAPTGFAAAPASRVAVVTSEGRRRTGLVSGRRDTDRRAEGSADDRFARDLPALRAAVRTMPGSAVRLLQNQLRARGSAETAHGVDVMILLAEALLRCRDAAGAVQAAGHAVQAAESLYPIDGRRRLCAYGVAADITLYAGRPAIAVYNEYLHQLTATGDWAGDALRTVYARAGHAVATWREKSREHGLQLLTDLCEWSRDEQGRHHAVTITLVEALTAMHAGCCGCGSRTPGRGASHDPAPPAPLPGGILQPDLIEPDRAYLASRVHDCPWGPP